MPTTSIQQRRASVPLRSRHCYRGHRKPARWWVARTKLVSTSYRPGLAERSGLELAVPFCQYTDRKSRLVDITAEAGRQRLAILPRLLAASRRGLQWIAPPRACTAWG